jgi:acetyltransferase
MISIRPIAREDGDAFQAFVRGLSPESRTNRFLCPVQELAPASLQALTQPDRARHVALVATEGGQIVAEGRYVALGDTGLGEFAIAVDDRWQRRGIGARILSALMAAGRRAGLAVLQGEVLRTNAAMLHFAQRCGFRFKTCAGDASLALVERDLWQGIRP